MPYYSATKSKAVRTPQGKWRNFRRAGGTRGETMTHLFRWRWRAKNPLRWTPLWSRA